MRKGFIFSILAIFFIALVILSFNLYGLVYRSPIYPEKNNIYAKNNYKYLRGNESYSSSETQKWCSVHLVYDPDMDNSNQNPITTKEYCINYETKRVI